MGRIYKNIVVFALAVLLFSGSVFSKSPQSSLRFESEVYDFGTIREIGGAVCAKFTFKNTGSQPIVIERVSVDCGCTVPKFDKEPVAPGESSVIEVIFDPANYPGRFNKYATVYSDRGRNRNTLRLTGYVIERPRTVEDSYPFSLGGGVRASHLHRAYEYISGGSAKSMTVEIINDGDSSVNISYERPENDYIQIFAPDALDPHQSGTVTLTYDFTGSREVYGVLSDRVFLVVDGKRCDMPFTMNAVAVDDFSGIDRVSAPVCEISPIYHNFGQTPSSQRVTKVFTIKNSGAADLVIRSVSCRRNTNTDLSAGQTIPAGASLELTISLDSGGGYGLIAGGITIICNDPHRPMRDLRVAAEFVDI